MPKMVVRRFRLVNKSGRGFGPMVEVTGQEGQPWESYWAGDVEALALRASLQSKPWEFYVIEQVRAGTRCPAEPARLVDEINEHGFVRGRFMKPDGKLGLLVLVPGTALADSADGRGCNWTRDKTADATGQCVGLGAHGGNCIDRFGSAGVSSPAPKRANRPGHVRAIKDERNELRAAAQLAFAVLDQLDLIGTQRDKDVKNALNILGNALKISVRR